MITFEPSEDYAKRLASHSSDTFSRSWVGLCKADAPDWSRLTANYIAEYLAAELPKVRATRKGIVAAIRSFLRFLTMEGVASKKLLKAIPRIRCWRYANLPEPLSPEQHEHVLKACQSETTGSRRDRAFVALLATLGIRGGELRYADCEIIPIQDEAVACSACRFGRGRFSQAE